MLQLEPLGCVKREGVVGQFRDEVGGGGIAHVEPPRLLIGPWRGILESVSLPSFSPRPLAVADVPEADVLAASSGVPGVYLRNVLAAHPQLGPQAEILGFVETKAGKVVRFDLVAKGEFWGEGRYTLNAPKGHFPLAVAFRLADGSDIADAVPPQGSRGWVPGYMR